MQHSTTRSFKPATYDPKSRTFQAIIASEQPAEVWDWDSFNVIRETLLMDGAVFPDTGKCPLLDAHARDSTKHILGHARNFRVDGSTMIADVFLDDGSVGDAVGRKIENGHLDSLSIGYRVLESRTLHDGQSEVIQGREFHGPLKVATRWQLFEVSLTPIGADSAAKIRSLPTMQTQTSTKPDQAQTSTRNADDAVRAERQRVSEIAELCGSFGLHEFSKRFISDGSSVDQAREVVLRHLARTNPPIGDARIEIGATESMKREDAIVDAMLLRSGFALEKPAPGAEQMRGVTTLDLCRDALRNSGKNPAGMPAVELITRAMTTSDFSGLVSNYVNKALRESYQNSPATFDRWTTSSDAADFKPLRRLALSEGPDLAHVQEAEEYTYAALAESEEIFQVAKWGRILKMSLELLTNDDLQSFGKAARIVSTAARRQLNKSVYQLLASGAHRMANGNPIFDALHGNLSEDGGAPDIERLTEARKAMRLQAGLLVADPLNITPKFLLVPVEWETEADQLVSTPSGFDATEGVGISNPFYGKLEVITEPMLDAISGNAWYVIGDPAQTDTVEVAYLHGQRTPFIEDRWEFSDDTYHLKCRYIYGVGCLDYRALYCNPGSNGEE